MNRKGEQVGRVLLTCWRVKLDFGDLVIEFSSGAGYGGVCGELLAGHGLIFHLVVDYGLVFCTIPCR